jgi:hypothetical protein
MSEKVVCVRIFLSQGLQYELTYGKIYNVESKPFWASEDLYFIKCDRNFITPYSKNIFVTLQEWRQQQLDKLI